MASVRVLTSNNRHSNPVFNGRKLKLGTFQSNLDSGCVMSALDGRLEITWPNTVTLAKLADEMEFEAIVPVARWRGFDGANNPQGAGFETYTWATGIAASTTKAGIVATSHCSLNHPIVAAKQSTVIDHVSGGRFTLNIVTGWNKPEIDMFGVDILEHDERYNVAEEWLHIVKRLWTEHDDFDHEGKYYRIKKGYLQPKPLQGPHPAIMNAGGSERGRHFAAKYCDIVYTVLTSKDFDECRRHIDSYRKLARDEYNREISVWSLAYIVQGETEKEARDFYNYYVHEKGDWSAAENVIATLGVTAKTIPPARMQAMKEHFVAGWSGYPLIGTKDQIVDGLNALSGIGLDGVLLSWPRYIEQMREFKDVTYPLLKQAGLR
ncbi:LLM class flavin-dependent oxidoreductase [Bradyrhizobium sp. AUGA SZCCT0182]|uniref:LLM class flavin-dependent oxidoreductase n=1 Tax=Bradyrhizobium sp. AUGA SZCCT0182 TaxID=2807667 RepID=UPI001BA62F98|nr:LLM class flavin-dependent oxidoreductase [Bradyrhizobium sp. AUGA SZCCT0182]MBR1235905.1 LLM class flavin-dependent oxidoreductase [Bradyrhizobium sp. AUGA SZCCT0182]